MIYFISDGTQLNVKDTEEIRVVNDFDLVLEFLDLNRGGEICFDTETTGLDAYKSEIHLVIIGNEYDQFVIDNSCGYPMHLLFDYESDYTWIAHNAKFDWKMLFVHYKVKLSKLYDTMIADQRICQGAGFKFGLEELCKRHCGYIPDGMDENITMTFTVMKPSMKLLSNKQIKYAARDIVKLPEIKRKQEEMIAKFKMQFLLYGIEFPLIRYLAMSELEGLKLNIPEWRKLIKLREVEKYDAEKKLDALVIQYRDSFFERNSQDWQALNGGVITRERNMPVVVEQLDFFGESKVITPNTKKSNINYDSTQQITKLFAKLKQPLPTEDGHYIIPIIGDDGKLIPHAGYDKDYNKVQVDKFTTVEDYLKLYLTENPNAPIKEFIETLLDFRSANTSITNFGENFIEKINPITGHIHTIFRQCASETGRLQSGGGNREPDKINGQNVKAEKEYRECFTIDDTENYEMLVPDLSGAEVRIMCDKANDQQLFEWAVNQDDAHSPIAQQCWRNIFLYRAGIEAGVWETPSGFFSLRGNKELLYILETSDDNKVIADFEKSKTYIVSKKVNKDVRTLFKNVTFAIAYGVYAAKCAKMLNVTLEEAEIVITTVKTTIPATYDMIERNCESVLGKKNWKGHRERYNNSYLVLNERTNARVWFTSVSAAKKAGVGLQWGEISEIEKACANYPIQGTQADMLKEAMVEVGRAIEQQELDANLLLNVHDELVYRSKKTNMVTYYCEATDTEKTIPFREFVPAMMVQVANRYLKHFQMSAETHVGATWTK